MGAPGSALTARLAGLLCTVARAFSRCLSCAVAGAFASARVARPFRLDTTATSAQRLSDLDHEWATQHACLAGGRMDGWLAAHRDADGGRGPLTMGYFTRADLPYYHALADAFTICDGDRKSVV